MKVLIIETNRCHLEILPMWSHLFCNDDVHFFLHRTAKSSRIERFFDDKCNATSHYSFFTPLSSHRHLGLVKRIAPDLIVLNSAEVGKGAMTAPELHDALGIPVVALCHKKTSYQACLGFSGVHPCALSPGVGSVDTTLNAVYFRVSKQDRDPTPLTLCAAGRVSWDRRYYDRLRDFSECMSGEDQIRIVGRCPSRFRHAMKKLMADCGNITLVENVKAFDRFIGAVDDAHAICPLIEPGSGHFDAYMHETFSGSINLSIALSKPMIGHELYLKTIDDLTQDCYFSYADTDGVEGALVALRSHYAKSVAAVVERREFLLNRSAENLKRILQAIQ